MEQGGRGQGGGRQHSARGGLHSPAAHTLTNGLICLADPSGGHTECPLSGDWGVMPRDWTMWGLWLASLGELKEGHRLGDSAQWGGASGGEWETGVAGGVGMAQSGHWGRQSPRPT